MNKMIYVLGAGAIGKALAVFLKLQQRDVVLVRTSTDNEPTHREHITVELGDKSILEADIEIATLSSFENFEGIIVLTNKSFANTAVANSLKGRSINTPIVVMQNGLNVEDPFIQHGFENIYRCVLFATSQTISINDIRFKPVAISQIGIIKGDALQLQDVCDQLNNTIFPFGAVDDIQSVIWRKTIANCVFNSICPLIDIDNGLFHRNELARTIALRVIDECVAVAREVGVLLDSKQVLDTVLLISKSSEGQLISTLQDIKNGRPTEIESLNFAIAKIAADVNKPDLTVETKLLGDLTRLKATINQ